MVSSFTVWAQIMCARVGTLCIRAETLFVRIQGRLSLRTAGLSGYNLPNHHARAVPLLSRAETS